MATESISRKKAGGVELHRKSRYEREQGRIKNQVEMSVPENILERALAAKRNQPPKKREVPPRVDMSNQLASALLELYTPRKKEALAENNGQVVEVVFHRAGKHMAKKSLRNVFKAILRKAGMRDMRFHDIRHTYASLLLSNGQSPVYVKEQMDHSNMKITVDIYGHLIPSNNRDAVNALDNLAPGGTY